MRKATRLLVSFMFYCIAGMGISMSIQASIGVSSFNSVNLALSSGFHITVGAATTALNGFFLVVYILLDRFRNPGRYVLQAAATLFNGRVINFFVYGIFADITPDAYPLRIALFILGNCISGSATGVILHLKILSFPVESACAELSRRTGRAFKLYRYALDGLFVLSSVCLSFVFRLPLFVREGTVISMFLLTGVIANAKRMCERWDARREKTTAIAHEGASET
jgi:uncharacterized membrane protein YczE